MIDKLIEGYHNVCDNCGKKWISENKTTVCPECIRDKDTKIHSHTQEPIIKVPEVEE